jgi:hypothetical protein
MAAWNIAPRMMCSTDAGSLAEHVKITGAGHQTTQAVASARIEA